MKQRMKGGPRYTVTSLQVAAKLWPTPRGTDWKNNGYQQKNGAIFLTMPGAVGSAKVRWPTPRAIDGRPKGNGPRPDSLMGAVNYNSDGQRIGTLNPTWVEWLMGYPLGWTACEASATR